ncbi:MAG TPA: glycosyltransferase family 4 protein [Flavisolibacter sp.]|nr:glycosyltransferase family 4 protein [Flavisolibacter sp.]
MARVMGIVSFRVYPTLMGGQKGVALFYEHLSRYLPVVLAASKDNEQAAGLELKPILQPNRKIYLNLFKLGRLRRLALDSRSSIILAEHSYTGWLAWLLHKRTGLPFIIHSHNMEGRRFRKMNRSWWKLYEWYEGWIHRQAHYNFFISREDMVSAIDAFRLKPAKCAVITYGVSTRVLERNKAILKMRAGLDPGKTLLLFNGTLDYEPNFEAIVVLIDVLVPALSRLIDNYQIVVTGNRAPGWLQQKMQACPHLYYAGYVPDADLYYQASDLFLNPVSNNTGVKTKLIEAIANNCTAISTQSGASGIDAALCGNKLIRVADGDWDNFAKEAVAQLKLPVSDTPQSFFEQYQWKNIAARAAEIITQVSQHHEPAS